MNENEVLTVTLTLENNEELECEVITIFEVQGQQYIALYPLFDEASDEDGSVYLSVSYTHLTLPTIRPV